MRVLHVMAGAPHGGAETAFADMCIAMQERDDVTIEAVLRPHPARMARLLDSGVKVHAARFGGWFDRGTTRHLRKVIAAFKPDIVQTWMSRAAQKTPPPSVSGPAYTLVARLGGYYKIAHFPYTEYFVAVTPDIQRFLLDEGIAPDRVTQINNFAEDNTGTCPVDRAGLQTPADAPLLVALGRLHRVKAFDILLQALAELPGVYLWIAGEGQERAALTAQCAALRLDDRVRFLGWREDRGGLLAAADICVLPSRFEPFGSTFVQAWAQGTPLVAAAADGPRQYVRGGEDALLVPVDDAPALAAALRRAIDDADLRTRLATAGRLRYEKDFTKAGSVAAYLDFYRKILERG